MDLFLCSDTDIYSHAQKNKPSCLGNLPVHWIGVGVGVFPEP